MMKKTTQQMTKKTFAILKSILGLVQIIGFIYAFLCVLYWFLKLTQAEFISNVAFLFEPLFSLVKVFYTQKTIPIEQVDLSGIIVCVVFIIITIAARIAKDIVIAKEELFDIKIIKERKRDDIRAQIQIEHEYISEMKKYNRFIILVNYSVKAVQSYLFDDSVKEADLSKIKISLMTDLFNQIQAPYIIQKAKYENDSFYIIGDIEKAHECVNSITTTIRELSKKYSNLNITHSHDLSFDAISNKSDINEKLELLKKIIQLNFNDSTLTTSLFKSCYELISKGNMQFSELGNFQFLINEKSTNCELYSVRIIKH